MFHISSLQTREPLIYHHLHTNFLQTYKLFHPSPPIYNIYHICIQQNQRYHYNKHQISKKKNAPSLLHLY